MRLIFYALLLANLAYFAWARWVDTPRPPPVNDVVARLPALKLVEGAPGTGQPQPPPTTRMALNEATATCVSIGPFPDVTGSTRAATLLRGKGFDPRQRTEEAQLPDGYWVYVGGLKNQAEADRAVATLKRSGIKDVVPVPETREAGRRLSLGLYKERARADRQAETAQKAGLKAEVAERTVPGTVYWVDMAPLPGSTTVPLEELYAGGMSNKVAAQPCPAGATPPPAPAPTPAPASPTPEAGTATTDIELPSHATVTASNPPRGNPPVGAPTLPP